MTNFTQIEASTPVVKPAEEEITYNKYWLANMRIEAGSPTRPVRLVASFVPARDVTATDENGNRVIVKELMPNAEPKRLVINNLFGEAAADPEGLGTVINGVLTVLKDRAIAKGLI